MATPDATGATLESNDPRTKGADSEDLISEDPKSENLNMDVALEDDKSEEEEGPHAATLPTTPSSPITVTSAHWETTLERLLRFPGMVIRKFTKLFRPSDPIAEIAFALGVTDSAYTITEFSWVLIAKRVFEVQSSCVMHSDKITFDIDAGGWITQRITDEWCARISQDLQRKGFRTSCTAMVAFVARVYLRMSSWIRYRKHSGKQKHKQARDALEHDSGAKLVTHCSQMA